MPTLPTDFASSTLAVLGNVLTGLGPLIYLILGVGLTAMVLVMIIKAIVHH